MITLMYFAAAALYAAIGMPAIAIGWLVLGTLRLYWSTKDVKRLALLALLLAAPATAAERTQEYYDSLPGVVYTNWFDSASDVAEGFVNTPGTGTPAIDLTKGLSGGASLKFTIPSEDVANGCGTWVKSGFGPWGEGDAFSIMWRQWFSEECFTEDFSGKSPKQIVISGAATCHKIEFTAFFRQQLNPSWTSTYTDCGQKPTHLFFPPYGAADYYRHWYESIERDPVPIPSVAVLSKPAGEYLGWYQTQGEYLRNEPGEWMTFMMYCNVGDYSTASSDLRLYVGRQNAPMVMIQSRPTWNFAPDAGEQDFDEFYIGPYITTKDSGHVHTPADTWYDNIVVREGTTPIPDPYYEPNARVRTRTIGGVR